MVKFSGALLCCTHPYTPSRLRREESSGINYKFRVKVEKLRIEIQYYAFPSTSKYYLAWKMKNGKWKRCGIGSWILCSFGFAIRMLKRRRFQIAISERLGLRILTSGGCIVKNFWLELLTSRRLARAGNLMQQRLKQPYGIDAQTLTASRLKRDSPLPKVLSGINGRRRLKVRCLRWFFLARNFAISQLRCYLIIFNFSFSNYIQADAWIC